MGVERKYSLSMGTAFAISRRILKLHPQQLSRTVPRTVADYNGRIWFRLWSLGLLIMLYWCHAQSFGGLRERWSLSRLARFSVCLLACFLSAKIIWGEGASVEKIALYDCKQECRTFFFKSVIDIGGPKSLWVVSPQAWLSWVPYENRLSKPYWTS